MRWWRDPRKENQGDVRERNRRHEACKCRASDHPYEERSDWVAYPMPPSLLLTIG